MSTVRLRLRDAVSLSWFHPVVLGSGFALYRVAAPFDIPTYIKRRLVQRARSVLLGEPPEQFEFEMPKDAVGEDDFRVIVSLRQRNEPGLKGRKIVKRMSHGPGIIDAVDRSAMEIRADWPGVVKSVLGDSIVDVDSVEPDIEKAVREMEVEIDVLYDPCALTDRRARNLVWYLELGLEGLSLRGEEQFYYLEPSYALQMEITSEVFFLEKLLRKNGFEQILRKPKHRYKRRPVVLNESAWRADRSAPGEFVFALSRLYSYYKENKYKDAVDRALPRYLAAWRKLRSEKTSEGVYDEEHRVNLIGIVPWLVTAMDDLHRTTGTARYAKTAFEMQVSGVNYFSPPTTITLPQVRLNTKRSRYRDSQPARHFPPAGDAAVFAERAAVVPRAGYALEHAVQVLGPCHLSEAMYLAVLCQSAPGEPAHRHVCECVI